MKSLSGGQQKKKKNRRGNKSIASKKEEKKMKNPCENCKRKPNCPKVCFPLRDYNRALYKKGRNKKK